jgi:esterase/lipase superfamily enzyme
LKYGASLWLAISLAGHQDARAKLMNERYIKWYTPYLSREFEMLVFGEKRGLPLILFPTSGARYYENKDFRLVAPVAWYIDNGRVTVYCPNAIDLEVSTINQFIQPIGCARTTRTKT